MTVIRQTSLADRLAAVAGIAAAAASLVGFIPGLYRDPPILVSQAHGLDLANLLGVLVLGLGLAASARGSVRGRLVAIGALGYLFYTYVAYAFLIVLNPATILYIAVLGFAGWSFALGFANVSDHDADAAVGLGLQRRSTGWFLIVVAFLFAANWLRQIAASVTSGELPVDLQQYGWPMNPYFVLDLGFLLPLMALIGFRLMTRRAGGVRFSVPLLVTTALIGISILATLLFGSSSGPPVDVLVAGMFVAVVLIATLLAAMALRPGKSTADTAG